MTGVAAFFIDKVPRRHNKRGSEAMTKYGLVINNVENALPKTPNSNIWKIFIILKMIKKKNYMVSQLFDLATTPLLKVQQDVQNLLNNLTGGIVRFQLQQVSNNELEATFYRSFHYPHTIGKGMIYELDAVMITGQRLPVPLPLQKFSDRIDYYIPVNDFLQCYKQSAADLKASRTKGIQLNILSDKVVIKLTY